VSLPGHDISECWGDLISSAVEKKQDLLRQAKADGRMYNAPLPGWLEEFKKTKRSVHSYSCGLPKIGEL
jgi:hypothetical protein